MKILFWNLYRRNLARDVCQAAAATSCDVVVLIESDQQPVEMLKELRSEVSPDFVYPRCVLDRFQLYNRDVRLDLTELYAGNRVSLRRLRYRGIDLTLGLVHLVDMWNWDASNQTAETVLLSQEVHEKERELGHSRTILIGDFNMNPFDQAMNMAAGLNAMMTVKCVERGTRTLQARKYAFFYNPMWSLLGDRTPGPPGTFYHTSSSKGQYGWNMLDQVLIRPSAVPFFRDVEILTRAGGKPLHSSSGRPDKEAASDHFPIVLTLE